MRANRTLNDLRKCVSWIRSKQNENIILKLKKSDDSFPDKLKINLKRKPQCLPKSIGISSSARKSNHVLQDSLKRRLSLIC